jgi:hypothetical protein
VADAAPSVTAFWSCREGARLARRAGLGCKPADSFGRAGVRSATQCGLRDPLSGPIYNMAAGALGKNTEIGAGYFSRGRC